MDDIDRDDWNRDRLDAFRAELKRRRLHGFVVPRGDEHQGEYVAGYAERLAWLTGFTGSAGMAVILRESAAIFVDGRYGEQARAEVDPGRFEFHHLTEAPPSRWIAANLPAKARLGYDPWLHTPDGVGRMDAACARAGGRLAAAADNPVDAVWTGRPPPPVGPVAAHDVAYAGESSPDKRHRLGRALAAERIDAAVLTAPDSIAWLLNIRGSDVPYTPVALAFAVLDSAGAVDLFIAPGKLTPDVEGHLGDGVRVYPPDRLGAALDRLGAERRAVRVDPGGTAAWIFDRLEAAGARLARGADPCALPKARKNPVELAGMRAAHRRDGAALCRFLAWLAAEAPGGGVTEIAAADRLEARRRETERFRGLSFPTISAAGPHGAIPHYRVDAASDRRLEPGSLYLVDSGGHYLDGTTDVTRTVAIGRPTAGMRDRFTRVLKAHISLATARFPKGTTGSQLDSLARRPMWEAGLDYDHGTGHGVGCYLCVHEGPQRISKLPNRIALEPGMVVSIEPGYYKSGEYGIRIENLAAVMPVAAPAGAEKELYGFETLTLAPIDRDLVDPSLLGADERRWLDAYHARVGEELAPLVDGDTAGWLDEATRPLA